MSKTIIAVFGSTETGSLALAKDLGFAIAHAGHILLTGGTGKPQILAVKEQAIAGADLHASSSGGASPWIGVDRDTNRVGHSIQKGDRAFVVETDLGHGRNCLEACLCDAAVALGGGDGTTSEALFSLYLGKPVVFLGDSWKEYGIDRGNADFDAMMTATLRRVQPIPDTDALLDSMFDRTRVLPQLSTSADYDWSPYPRSTAAVADVISTVEIKLGGNTTGAFPPIARYADVINEYNAWLKRQGR